MGLLERAQSTNVSKKSFKNKLILVLLKSNKLKNNKIDIHVGILKFSSIEFTLLVI